MKKNNSVKADVSGLAAKGAAVDLFNMDCMELMAKYPDKHFDLAIVDPPYGNYKIKENSSVKMFDNNEPPKEYWDELIRVSKNQIVWGINYFQNVKLTGGAIIWNKLGQDTKRRKQAPTISEAEIAYQSFNNLVKMFSYAWIGNITGHNYQINSPEFANRIHPTEKPIALYNWIYQNYAEPKQKILDTHLGSGSSAISAYYFDINFVGCEIDKEYFYSAQKRFKDATAQTVLF